MNISEHNGKPIGSTLRSRDPNARPGLRGGTAAAAALGAGRLGLRAAAGSGRGGPRRTAGGGEPWRSASLQIQKKGGDGGYSGDTLDVFLCF